MKENSILLNIFEKRQLDVKKKKDFCLIKLKKKNIIVEHYCVIADVHLLRSYI